LRREPQALTFADLSEIIGMWLKAGL